MLDRKCISVLGATGSVGTQALDVARSRGLRVDFLSVNMDVARAEDAVREFSPSFIACADESAARDLATRIADTATRVLYGSDGILEGISLSKSETVVNSILGEAGLMPTLAVIDSGKRLALANKESLVIAGDIVMRRAKEKSACILPVDSEHSAIFQSLHAGKPCEIKKLILTASGGPFYGRSREELKKVTLSDTLAHPTWKMGKKITVDSATLMNKAFEVIEAVHLFSVPPERIEVVIHRQSILHSAVEYIDNSVIGELSVPDMRMCVEYAIDYPDRAPSIADELDLISVGALTFAAPDTDAFPLLSLGKRAIGEGGAMPAVMNAADEVAVAAFLDGAIRFSDIPDVVSATYDAMLGAGKCAFTLDDIISSDRAARAYAAKLIKEK